MRLLSLILAVVLFSLPVFAADAPAQGQPQDASGLMSTPSDDNTNAALPQPPPPPASKMGTLTGGACALDKDCVLGCAPKSKAITCLNTKEGSDACLKDRFYIPPEETCGCLPDIHRCGFLGRDVRHH